MNCTLCREMEKLTARHFSNFKDGKMLGRCHMFFYFLRMEGCLMSALHFSNFDGWKMLGGRHAFLQLRRMKKRLACTWRFYNFKRWENT